MRRAFVTVGLLLALLVGAGAWYLAPIGPVATGYAAQIVCGAHHLSGRTVDDAMGDLPANPLVPFLRAEADGAGVRATLLGAYESLSVRQPRSAGGGCQLADADAADPDGPRGPQGDVPAPTADVLTVPGDLSAAATEAGFDPTALADAVADAFGEPTPLEDAPADLQRGTRAVAVVRDGVLVAEQYADGFDAETPLLGWSMAKTVANAVAGTLVRDGAIALGDDDLWPDWTGDDPRRAITLGHLLTMTDGLAFEEVYDPGTDATTMLFTPTDTGAFAADKPLVADPGTRWSYSSGTSNLLCDVLATADGEDPATLAHRRVFDPLGMSSATLGIDAAGDPVCSSFAYATARDWARLGILYEQDGVVGGTRLLPEGWVEWSTTPVPLDTEQPYGAQVWLNAGPGGELRMPSVPADAFWASGNEGQHVVVLPSQQLVVVRLGLARGYDGIGWGLEPLLRGIIDATGEVD